MYLQNRTHQKIIILSISFALIASLFSCDRASNQKIWVAIDVVNQNYSELWFGHEEIMIIDEDLGYYRVPYNQKRNRIYFDSEIIKFTSLSVEYTDNNRILLKNNDSVYFTCLDANIPYSVNPLMVDFISDKGIEEDLTQFMSEFNNRRNYFHDYLHSDTLITNY